MWKRLPIRTPCDITYTGVVLCSKIQNFISIMKKITGWSLVKIGNAASQNIGIVAGVTTKKTDWKSELESKSSAGFWIVEGGIISRLQECGNDDVIRCFSWSHVHVNLPVVVKVPLINYSMFPCVICLRDLNLNYWMIACHMFVF